MQRDDVLTRILDRRLIAVIRSPDAAELVECCRALADGGIDIVEITFTTPGAEQVLRDVRRELGDAVLVGAGTILDAETARIAVLAGADFIVGPTTQLDVIRLAKRYGKIVMPGAFTPTEVMTAWEAGADIVKVFPADMGGPRHLKALLGPLPHVRLMPTGGVDLKTARSFLDAGACALGLGSALVDATSLAERSWDSLRSRAADFVRAIG